MSVYVLRLSEGSLEQDPDLITILKLGLVFVILFSLALVVLFGGFGLLTYQERKK
jgi:hypothetical protein